MEYSTDKKEITKYVLIAAAFLGVGAVVVFALILAPGLGLFGPATDTTTPPADIDTGTDTDTTPDTEVPDTDGTDTDSDTDGTDTEIPDTETPEVGEDTDGTDTDLLPDTGDEVEPSQTTPSATWGLAISATMECADDAGNLADVTYTVVLENDGNASGVISEVVASLETVVTAAMLSNVSDGGTYNETTHQITWNNSGAGYTLNADSTESFTYVVQFDKRLNHFTTMETDVTAEPGDGSIPPAAAQSTTNVGCDIPDTAIGDEEWTLPILLITSILVLLAIGELKYGLVTKLMGEDMMDNVRVAVGSKDTKSIVEKRLLRKS